MTEQDLRYQIARLESINDILETDLKELDNLLKKVGFKSGLKGVKRGALQLLEEKECTEP